MSCNSQLPLNVNLLNQQSSAVVTVQQLMGRTRVYNNVGTHAKRLTLGNKTVPRAAHHPTNFDR